MIVDPDEIDCADEELADKAESGRDRATEDQLDEDQVIESDSVDTEPVVDTDPVEVRPRSLALAILALAAAIVVGALIFGGISAWHLHVAQHRQDRDAAILSTSRQAVADLVTLRHDSAAGDIKRIADTTTGKFHDQFADTGGTFLSVLQQGQVVSTGAAKEVALVDANDQHATVLAAVVSTVQNTEAPTGQQRVYRMKVSLDSVDGRWLVSNVEFVS
ncbi:hypothetical protein [Nocardia sp.]|uniref:hypothetical protein n=1 Tax=Nocardia sp. TaxID=1821 RepID=UPI002618256E|nr:hypothetical protein [Nocardia sp.]